MNEETMIREDEIDFTNLQYTRKWFSKRNLADFRRHVKPKFAGQPCVYLEIGVFEGLSLVWMFQQVLTHHESRAVGIDTWLMTSKRSNADMDEVMARAHHNLAPWIEDIKQNLPRCLLLRAMSADALRMMCRHRGQWGIQPESVDLCMIDGHHSAAAVLDDAQHVFQLTKPGGWILFDDVRNDKPKSENHVLQGMEQWLAEVGDRVRPIWSGRYIEAFEKVR